jgi:hypothetical protein
MALMAAQIVRVANGKVGSKEWLYGAEKDEFKANTNKCNKFVYDVLVEAGVKPPPSVPKYVVFSRPPTAGEWADPAVEIMGCKVVTDAQPGDVAAEAHQYSDATGHVAIVVATNLTVSAAATFGGQIVKNDWGFRKDQSPTFRRVTP